MQINKSVLDNGLRVITVSMPHVESMTAMIVVGVGSRYEEKEHQGVAHFIEHMMFKGTEKRPTPLVIATEMDEIGAEFNAFTGKEYIGFYVKAAAEHLPLALDVLVDMFLNSKFEEDDVGRERGVILEEMRMFRDDPQAFVDILYDKLVFGDHPLGWPIVGWEEAIEALSRRDLLGYIDSWFSPGNTVVGVAGGVTHQEVVAEASLYLERFEAAPTGKPFPFKAEQRKPRVLIERRETDQTNLGLGVRGYPLGHPKRYAYTVLNTILGRGMSSRLFIQVREERGLAYYIGSWIQSYTDTGTLATFAGVNNQQFEEALRVIVGEFRKLKSDLVPPRELAKAKAKVRGEYVLAFEDSSVVVNSHSKQEVLRGEMETLEELMKKIDAVSAEEVQAVARELFINKSLNLALIGPVKDKDCFLPILDLS